MNHEERIKKLEKEIALLKHQLYVCGFFNQWLPIAQASEILHQSAWVIKNRIKSDEELRVGEHYIMNGNRYVINIEAWRRLLSKTG